MEAVIYTSIHIMYFTHTHRQKNIQTERRTDRYKDSHTHRQPQPHTGGHITHSLGEAAVVKEASLADGGKLSGVGGMANRTLAFLSSASFTDGLLSKVSKKRSSSWPS